jgi:hypothetical protein
VRIPITRVTTRIFTTVVFLDLIDSGREFVKIFNEPIIISINPTIQLSEKRVTNPKMETRKYTVFFNQLPFGFLLRIIWANGGRIASVMTKDEMRANVFVNARGLKSLPSAPSKVNTGKKLMTVVEMAVNMALLTSDAAVYTISKLLFPYFSFSKCLKIFSVRMIPISTIVPMAIAIPERATTLASTPKYFIAINADNTVRGRRPEIMIAELIFINISSTTIMVISISSVKALYNCNLTNAAVIEYFFR